MLRRTFIAAGTLAAVGCARAEPNAAELLKDALRLGGTILLAEGTYTLLDADVAPGTRIEGVGPDTVLQLGGAGNLLRYSGAISLSNLTLDGAGLPAEPYRTGMAVTGRGAASLQGVALRGWGGSYWVNVNDGDLTASNCTSVALGNALNGVGITYASTVFSVYGSGAATVTNCAADLKHGKTLLSVWAGCSGVVQRSIIRMAGYMAGSDMGGYGLLCYRQPDTGPQPTLVVEDCEIDAYGCGIYAANAASVVSRRNHYTGQADPADQTIPKAGLAANGCRLVVSEGDTFADCRSRYQFTGCETVSVR